MPKRKTTHKPKKPKGERKTPVKKASDFVREEMERAREERIATSQAIAIGDAQKAGVDVPPPEKAKLKEPARGRTKKALVAEESAAPALTRTRPKKARKQKTTL